MRPATLTAAYLEAGYKIGNPRNQWSAQRDDPPGVAVTVWDEQVIGAEYPRRFDTQQRRPISEWGHRVGNKVRARHLQHSLDHLGGWVDLILIAAADTGEEPRRIASRRFWADHIGHLKRQEFDPATGAFVMEIYKRDGVTS